MSEMLYLNGEIMPLSEGRIDVEDRGFQFGDGIYETLRCYDGQPLYLSLHLERLAKSAAELFIDLPFPLEEFEKSLLELIEQAGIAQAILYIQVTRGVAKRLHNFPEDAPPTVVAYVRDFHPLSPEIYENGVTTMTAADNRWDGCHIKTICLLPNVLVKEKARRAGVFEAFYYGTDDTLYEGSTSNAFYFKDGELFTHPLTNKVLPGVTRQVLLDIAAELGIPVHEEPRKVEDFTAADEVFLASSTREMVGVVKIDETTIADGKVGPLTKKLHAAYSKRVNVVCAVAG